MILSARTNVKTELIESAGILPDVWPYQTFGDPAKPPVVFLHGFLGSGEDWLRIVDLWTRDFFLILPDLPGHGKNTSLDAQFTLDFDTLNAGILGLLDSLERQHAHWVGYSMGGRAALYFAVHHPERVTSLTLESTSPGLTSPEERRARAVEDDRRAESILNGGIEAFVEQWYTLPLFRSLRTYPGWEALVQRRKANHPGWVAKVIRELSPGRQPPVWDRLPRLGMPVLIVAGALDEKYVDLGEQVAARIPHARLAIIPNAGHNVHLEQPDQFASLLQDFLKGADKIPHI